MNNDQLPTTALGLVSLFPSNKAELKEFIKPIKTSCIEGFYDAFEFDAKKKYFELFTKEFDDKEYKEAVIHSFKRQEKDKIEINGLVASLASRSNYDYSCCQMWVNLKKQEADLKEQIKKLQTLMETIEAPMFDENGEEITPAVKLESTQYILYK